MFIYVESVEFGVLFLFASLSSNTFLYPRFVSSPVFSRYFPIIVIIPVSNSTLPSPLLFLAFLKRAEITRCCFLRF